MTHLLLAQYNPSPKTDNLWCNRWSDASWVSYLNLINIIPQQRTSWIPWEDIPTPEIYVLELCKSELYMLYKSLTLKQLSTCVIEQVPAGIDKLLRVHRILGTREADLYRDLVDLLAARDCPYPEVLSNIWRSLCHSDAMKVAVFEAAIAEKSSSVLSYTLRVARKVQFDFWGAWYGQPSFQYCPVTDALLNGKKEQLTILLRNGFQQNLHRVYIYDKVFQASINPAYLWLRAPLALPTTPTRRKILTEVLLFVLHICNSSSSRRRRTLIECFHLLWDGCTDASPVSAAELAAEVRHRFRDFPPELHDETGLRESPFRHLYHLNFGFGQLYQLLPPRADPRSLLHLSRMRVRRALAQNLPCDAQKLPLPPILQNYVTEV